MNILIAPDKFKGSLTAREVCTAIETGLRKNYPEATIRHAPLADGGDGTLAILQDYLHLRGPSGCPVLCREPRPLETVDPLGRPLTAIYLETDTEAFIELATASGLVLLREEERNPLLTSTYGTGLQLRDALVRGKKEIGLLLGGSATNDLGLGIAEALDFRFLSKNGRTIRPTGGQLRHIVSIISPQEQPWKDAEITLLCDVDNSLYGPRGAAHVYAAQKGASSAMIEQLEAGARHMSEVLETTTGTAVAELPGGGVAGGIGAGLVALLGARMTGGFQFISALSGLSERVAWADVVISGEGQIDEQSLQGKVVGGVLELCLRHRKPCHLFTGRNQLPEIAHTAPGITSVQEIRTLAPDTASAMAGAAGYLTQLASTLKVD